VGVRSATASGTAGGDRRGGEAAGENRAAVPAADGEAVLLVGSAAVRLWNPAIVDSVSAASTVQTGAPDPGGSPAAVETATASTGAVVAPMHGTILSVGVRVGEEVGPGSPIAILEAMKMETTLTAPRGGRVEELRVEPGTVVQGGDVVAIVGSVPTG
jgi:biotin carboxyl carrier protein